MRRSVDAPGKPAGGHSREKLAYLLLHRLRVDVANDRQYGIAAAEQAGMVRDQSLRSKAANALLRAVRVVAVADRTEHEPANEAHTAGEGILFVLCYIG